MPVVLNTRFKSEFGFESPGFSVDSIGNIIARTISLDISDPVISDPDLPADFSVTEVGGNFRISGELTNNPTITVYRTRAITIDVTLSTLTFNIFQSNLTTFYNEGLVHSSGDVGVDAQGKTTGRLAWTVPLTAPDTLYYSNAAGTVYGTINVQNAPSAFSEVDITSTTQSTSVTTGALRVAGGVGIAGDLFLGGDLNIQGLGIPRLAAETNLELDAGNKIIFKIDNVLLGSVNSNGFAIPLNSSSIEASTINSTTIGETNPSTAAFTSATVSAGITTANSVTNKAYVDSTATALAIAFGL